MKKVDAAYLAGIVDGEAYLGIVHNNGNDYQLRLDIRMADAEDMLRSFAAIHGGSVYPYPTKPNRKDQTGWIVRKRDELRSLLKVLLPYLRLKKERAEIGLAFLDTVQDVGKGPIPDAVAKKRQRLYNQMRRLTKTGRPS